MIPSIAIMTMLAAQSAATKLEVTLGFFDPYAPFSSPLQRADFVKRLAGVLSSDQLEVRAETYSKENDAARDFTSGKLSLGLIHPQFLVEDRMSELLEPISVGTRRGSPTCRYGLYVPRRSRARNLRQLKNTRLAVVRAGRDDLRFVHNGILSGEIRSDHYFDSTLNVPDLAGALGTLKFKRADAFFGPDIVYGKFFTGRQVKKIADIGAIPCTVVAVSRRMSSTHRDALVDRLQDSQNSLRPLLARIGLDGFTSPSSGQLLRLQDAMRHSIFQFERRQPMLIKPKEPDQKLVLKEIFELDADTLPSPSSLTIERDRP
ncbi:MAG: PhnD/SsuA/transferrin family substrate-binding protein [Myxococcota bacterium]